MNESKWLSIGDELIESVKEKFPSNAEHSSIIDHARRSYLANIHWKLNNDEKRPNKLSRIILIVVSGEAIEDSEYDKRQKLIHERFKNFVDSKLAHFDPEHNEPYDKAPPVEEWLVTTDILNS